MQLAAEQSCVVVHTVKFRFLGPDLYDFSDKGSQVGLSWDVGGWEVYWVASKRTWNGRLHTVDTRVFNH